MDDAEKKPTVFSIFPPRMSLVPSGLVRRVEGPRVGTIADHTRLPYLFNGRQMRLTDVYGELIPQIVASEIS